MVRMFMRVVSIGLGLLALDCLEPGTPLVSATADQARELHRLVNRHRQKIGQAGLIWDERLAAVAERHSRDMARRDFFDHRNPDGSDPFERLEDAGVRFQAAAENIAEGPVDPREALDGWLNSRGHRRNLQNSTYTHHGVGIHRGYWTHVFVRYPSRGNP